MHLIHRTLATCVSTVLLLAACNEGGSTSAPQSGAMGSGKVTVNLTLSHLVQVNRVDYTISAPDLGILSGSFKVGHVPNGRITAVLSPVPAGRARTLAMSTKADNGALCEGTGTADVIVGGEITAEILLSCSGGSAAPLNEGMAEEEVPDSTAGTAEETPAPQDDSVAGTITAPPVAPSPPTAPAAPVAGMMPGPVVMAPEPDPGMTPVEAPVGSDEMSAPNPSDDGMTEGSGDDAAAGSDGTASLVGSWISPPLVFETSLFAPALGQGDATVTQTMIARITADGSSTAQICSLDFEETHVGLSFVSSVQMLQTPAPTQLSTTEVALGAAFPVTELQLTASGLTAMSSVLGGEVTVDVTVNVALTGTVDSQDSVSGTSSFTSSGPVSLLGLVLDDMRIPAEGPPPNAPFTIKKVSDDPTLTCEQAAALLN